MRLRSLGYKMQASILGRAPAADDRRTVFIVPSQPREELEIAWYRRDLTGEYFRKSPYEDVFRYPCRGRNHVPQPLVVIVPVSTNALVVPGIEHYGLHRRRGFGKCVHDVRRLEHSYLSLDA